MEISGLMDRMLGSDAGLAVQSPTDLRGLTAVIVSSPDERVTDVMKWVSTVGMKTAHFQNTSPAIDWLRAHVGRTACAILANGLVRSPDYPFFMIELRNADAGVGVVALTTPATECFTERSSSFQSDVVLQTCDSMDALEEAIVTAIGCRQAQMRGRSD